MIAKIFCSLRPHGASFRSFAPGPPKLLGGHGVGGGNCMALEIGHHRLAWPDRRNLHRERKTGKVESKSIEKISVRGCSFSLTAILALFAIDFPFEKFCFSKWCFLKSILKMPIYEETCHKMSKIFFRSDKHGIRRDVLSQSRGRALKKFPGGHAPRPPPFRTLS